MTNEIQIENLADQFKDKLDLGVLQEAIRLGTAFSDPRYHKAYRRITIPQIDECLTYLASIEVTDYDDVFDGCEASYTLPNTENINDQDKPDFYWTGHMFQTGMVSILKSTKLFKEVNVPILHFITCLIEGSHLLESNDSPQ